jgi:hypothetical protein
MNKKIKQLEQEITLLSDVLNIPKQTGVLLSSHQQKLLERMISEKEHTIRMLTMQD